MFNYFINLADFDLVELVGIVVKLMALRSKCLEIPFLNEPPDKNLIKSK